VAPRAPLPPAGESLGGLSVGAGQQPLANARPGQILVTTHTHTHPHPLLPPLVPPARPPYGCLGFMHPFIPRALWLSFIAFSLNISLRRPFAFTCAPALPSARMSPSPFHITLTMCYALRFAAVCLLSGQ
jgi:hypothetical protein